MRPATPCLLSLLAVAACGSRGSSPPPLDLDWRRGNAIPTVLPQDQTASSTIYETGIEDPEIVFDTSAQVWRLYFATRLADTANPTAAPTPVIRCAESSDLRQWTRIAGDALGVVDALAWDGDHIAAPCVVTNPDPLAPPSERWLMFYAGGNAVADQQAGRPRIDDLPFTAIGLAYSPDGRTFTRRAADGGRVLTGATVFAPGAVADASVGDPDAIVRDDRIELYCSSHAFALANGALQELAAGVSRVDSTSGINWSAPATNPLLSLQRPGAGASLHPTVQFDRRTNTYQLLFTSDVAAEAASMPTAHAGSPGYWLAASTDGVAWQPDFQQRHFAWDPSRGNETYGLVRGACLLPLEGSTVRLCYAAWSSVGTPDAQRYVVPLRDGSTPIGTSALSFAIRQLFVAL